MKRWVESVPNFSEGRNVHVVEKIARSISSCGGVLLLDQTHDPDHNRSVFTFAGEPQEVEKALLQAAETAVREIDLRRHRGVHPRIGALDVAPFVPLEGVTPEECVSLAWRVGEELWSRLRLPVYFYGDAAKVETRRRLENIRRGVMEALSSQQPGEMTYPPDVGGPAFHPTAGACVVGVRKFLIAYNVNLAAADIAPARQIARQVRESSGGLPAVKALALRLPSRKLTQVSMNLTDFEQTPPHVVFDRIREEAERLGIEIAGTELIGLIPRAALAGAPKEFAAMFRRDQILESRIEAAASGRPD